MPWTCPTCKDTWRWAPMDGRPCCKKAADEQFVARENRERAQRRARRERTKGG